MFLGWLAESPTSCHGLKSNKCLCNRWQKAQLLAFEAVETMIARDVLLTYPDPNKPFDIETDTPDYQLGTVIKQHGCPIAFFSCTLMGAQRNYTMIQEELLSIVKTLITFHLILLGSQLHIWTDHVDLTYTNITSQQVLRWQLYIKEYAPMIHWKAGKENIEAATLSCYSHLERESKDKQFF
jgi:hypothetical protein